MASEPDGILESDGLGARWPRSPMASEPGLSGPDVGARWPRRPMALESDGLGVRWPRSPMALVSDGLAAGPRGRMSETDGLRDRWSWGRASKPDGGVRGSG